MIIECMTYKEAGIGTFAGYADLYLPELGLEIFNCTMHKKDGRRWVNLPVRSYKKGPEERFFPILRFRDQQKFKDFCICAKEAIDKFVSKQEKV